MSDDKNKKKPVEWGTGDSNATTYSEKHNEESGEGKFRKIIKKDE